jgi:hypothetical protein
LFRCIRTNVNISFGVDAVSEPAAAMPTGSRGCGVTTGDV